MFDFIPDINVKINNDPFMSRIGGIVSYTLKTNYDASCHDVSTLLQQSGWQVNLKDEVLLASKGDICSIVFREGYTSLIFNPAKIKDYEDVSEYISEIMNALAKIGVTSFRPYWRIDDEFFFKEATNVDEKYTEVKNTLLSGKFLNDKDTYELVENGVSLNIEFCKNTKNNSCNLSVYVLSTEEIEINFITDALKQYYQIAHKTLLNVVSVDVLSIMKGGSDDK